MWSCQLALITTSAIGLTPEDVEPPFVRDARGRQPPRRPRVLIPDLLRRRSVPSMIRTDSLASSQELERARPIMSVVVSGWRCCARNATTDREAADSFSLVSAHVFANGWPHVRDLITER